MIKLPVNSSIQKVVKFLNVILQLKKLKYAMTKKPIKKDILNAFNQLIFNSAPTMMAINKVDDKTFVQVNDAFVNTLGYSREEIIGKSAKDLNLFNDEQKKQIAADKLLEKGCMKDVELNVRTKNGEILNGLFNGEIIEVDSIEYILTSMTDITQQKNAEKQLLDTNIRLQLATDSAGVGIWDFDIKNNKLVWDDKMCQLYGISRQDFDQHKYPWKSLLNPDDAQWVVEKSNKTIENGKDLDMEFRIIRPDGEKVYIRSKAVVVRDENNQPIRMTGINYDITKSKLAEQALKDSEDRFKALHNATFGGIAIHDNGLILDCNQGLSDLTGFSVEELIGMNGFLLFSEKNREQVMQMVDNKYEKPYEAIGLKKDGSEYPIRLQSKNIPYKGKTVRVTEVRDLSESREAQKEHARIMAAVDQLAESVMITDPDGYIVYVNPAFSNITGYSSEEVIGRNTAFLESGMHEKEYYYHIYDVIDCGETWKGRFTNLKKDGSTYISQAIISPVKDDDGKIVNLVAVEQDVTESVIREEQMQQSQKMESIGKLAGGVAHDFNNLLMAIMGYVDLCRDELEPEHPVFELLNEITSAADKSVLITKQLLAFARKQNISPKIINLNEAISGILKLLCTMIGEDISLNWVPCDDPWMVKIDPSQIDQIMTNLFVNARDAIDGVGNIMIETYRTEIRTDYACGDSAGVAKGQYMVIAFSDDGCGMDKKTQSNIFEPFFTTKDIGQGTGLGLATIYGIVGQNNGYVNVYSEPAQGTTFRIYLPRFNAENADKYDASDKDPAGEIQGGSETILLVEDEANIRAITSLILQKLGYKVLAAEKPASAIEISNEYEKKIDLLLTDVVMPEQNGINMAEELMKNRPNMKQLFMSGYTENVIFQKDIVKEEFNFLPKPFSTETLAVKIREILDNQ